MRLKTTVSSLFLSAALCTGFQPVAAAQAESPQATQAQAAIEAADAARKQAASAEGEWRDTGKLIKKAQSALKAGDFDKAIQLADQAKAQGELGQAQALSQQSASMKSYIRY